MTRLVSDRALFRVMGNESFTETWEARVLDRAIDSLRRAFPPEWGIDLAEAISPDRPGREDLLVVRTPAGAVAEFAIEVKSDDTRVRSSHHPTPISRPWDIRNFLQWI